jgi:plasmid stability protein
MSSRGRSIRYGRFFLFSHKYGIILGVRTTVDIPDPVYRRLKIKAASEGRSVKELVLRAVHSELSPTPREAKVRKAPIIHSKHPGSLLLDNDKIFEIVPFP